MNRFVFCLAFNNNMHKGNKVISSNLSSSGRQWLTDPPLIILLI